MNASEIVKHHFDAWNRHDADAIVATLAQGCTYTTPIAGQDLTAEAVRHFAQGIFTAFLNESFEILTIGDTGGGLVAAKWLGRATNTGALADCGTLETSRCFGQECN